MSRDWGRLLNTRMEGEGGSPVVGPAGYLPSSADCDSVTRLLLGDVRPRQWACVFWSGSGPLRHECENVPMFTPSQG